LHLPSPYQQRQKGAALTFDNWDAAEAGALQVVGYWLLLRTGVLTAQFAAVMRVKERPGFQNCRGPQTLSRVPYGVSLVGGHNLRQRRIEGMNSGNQDKAEGTGKKAMGTVKEKVGEAIGNPDLRDRGTAEKVEGKVQDKVGDIKKVFED
jgi:uncharacterized protein YjbJ (UPF0337 family)